MYLLKYNNRKFRRNLMIIIQLRVIIEIFNHIRDKINSILFNIIDIILNKSIFIKKKKMNLGIRFVIQIK